MTGVSVHQGINAKHPAVAFFQRDVLMVDDDMPDAVKQQFKRTLLLWIGHNIKNVNPACGYGPAGGLP
jgi:hypothetical protein